MDFRETLVLLSAYSVNNVDGDFNLVILVKIVAAASLSSNYKNCFIYSCCLEIENSPEQKREEG